MARLLRSLWSKDLAVAERHYEFEIRRLPRSEESYLTITQTSVVNGRQQRVALTIHPHDLARFLFILQEVAAYFSTRA